MEELKKLSPEQKKAKLWFLGILAEWKLDTGQLKVHRLFNSAFSNRKTRRFFLNWSRRRGKTFTMLLDCIEQCLRTRNGIFKFAAQTQKQVKEIIIPILNKILEDCPPEYRPIWRTQEGCYIFPTTGARLGIAGCDGGHAEKLRGASLDRGYIDEAGQIKNLKYVLNDILLPQTLTTGGSVVISSTPPDTPAHDYYFMCMDAKIDGNYAEMDIYTNPRLTQEIIDEAAKDSGGIESDTFKREYLCQFITDATRAIIPGFAKYKDKITVENERPPFFDSYESMDIGFKDFTVVLFSYYDFKKAKTIIEDEFVINGVGMTTDALAKGIKDKRKELFKSKKPHYCVMDTDLILQNDLALKHDLIYANAKKEEKATHLNHLILMLQNGEILINPRCKVLLAHLEAGIWDKNRQKFARIERFGHFDAIDALLYLSRAVDKTKNPYPALYGEEGIYNSHLTRKEIEQMKKRHLSSTASSLVRAFNLDKKRRK